LKTPSSIQRWGLVRIFGLSSFISIISISIVSGLIFFSFLREHLLQHEISISSSFIQSVSLINNPEDYFLGNPNHEKQDLEEYFRHIIGMPEVIAATAYNTDLQIIWSSNENMIGKTFTDNDELKRALSGQLLFKEGHTHDHSKQEHISIPDTVEDFIESYIPVWDSSGKKVIGVVEIYKSPESLYQTIHEGRTLVIVVSLIGGFILYWLLYWIVSTAQKLIETQSERIKQATSRAVELNELNLRRIGADLHDGPAQSIGYALLRLDSLVEDRDKISSQGSNENFNKIQGALADALQEIRDVSAGLVIPELTDLTFEQAIHRLIEKHEDRTSTKVKQRIEAIPDGIKASTRICLYRIIQEGLNNAYRHGQGINQSVEMARDGDNLKLLIKDSGPGMGPDKIARINESNQLGLRGLRERVESLGGIFQITSNQPEPGVQLHSILPIKD
jgi:hypothetical protein